LKLSEAVAVKFREVNGFTIPFCKIDEVKVPWSYLPEQFNEKCFEPIFAEMKKLVQSGDYTLGKYLTEFETRFAQQLKVKHAIGVNSGTDALKLALWALGVGHGDEVITAANTFIATVGAINELGAKPVLVDCTDDFCLDVEQVTQAITNKTKAIIPVHLTGKVANMKQIMEIAKHYNLAVVEDACQCMYGKFEDKHTGTYGNAGAFSLHPLKALNVWGDGGVIITNDDDLNQKLRSIRNHGLINRDEIGMFGVNSRLDTLHAIIGNWLVDSLPQISNARTTMGNYFLECLKDIPQIKLPISHADRTHVFHLFIMFAERRDELYTYCSERGIEVKVHYPIPLYQQQGLQVLGYKPGDFPVTDRHAKSMISFPLHQYITKEHVHYMVNVIKEFYEN
jgi:dTDP-3-amino-2,3,6-trideoxy-4-keto-D-glucose/dTDP-3-amino-3,4,6-trideoxy-alpha-D-glucose/dTDP-2,6-dideoxy-D-kanosamine transaminase